MKVERLNNLDPSWDIAQQWEALVRVNSASGFMQSLAWADFKRRQGMRYLHLGLREGEDLVGGAIFYTSHHNKGAGFFMAPEGPVLPWNDKSRAQEGLSLLLKAAESSTGTFDTMAVRIEPRVQFPGPVTFADFGRAPVDLVPRETLYLNIEGAAEDILKAMHPKARYNIGLSHRRGVIVKEDNSPEAIRRFYSVLQEAASRDQFLIEPFKFFTTLWDSLAATGMVKLLFAEYEGETLGALMLVSYGQRSTYLYGGITNKKRNLMAGYALQWAAITEARSAGSSIYDFYGYDQFMAPRNSYAKFSRFKSQFGGQPIRFVGAHDHYFLDRLADVVVRAVNELDLTGMRT
ncbi:MAG: peptidoglycan bridge formation glycyltransferase FemA/FemB family protein [Candidatus Obscuribacterales bacterium]|nr:peptidoglycan bridge formation glycyltransferase FemA/FemB family protein [Candidatus Obscuribacterales bacterium]